MKIKCSLCRKMGDYFDRKPDSLLVRLWKWHCSWCPCWKEQTEKKD